MSSMSGRVPGKRRGTGSAGGVLRNREQDVIEKEAHKKNYEEMEGISAWCIFRSQHHALRNLQPNRDPEGKKRTSKQTISKLAMNSFDDPEVQGKSNPRGKEGRTICRS